MEIKHLNFRDDDNRLPLVIIKEKHFNYILEQIRSTNLEITYIVSFEKQDNRYISKEVYLPPQWNSPAETKTIDSQYSKWAFDLANKGIILNGHGHSHPKMAVNPSGYDIDFYNKIKRDTETFQIRLIINQKGYIRCDLCDYSTYRASFEEIPVYISCEGFIIIATTEGWTIKVDPNKDPIIESINENLTVTLKSEYLKASVENILTTPLPKEDYIKVVTEDPDVKVPTKNTYNSTEKIYYKIPVPKKKPKYMTSYEWSYQKTKVEMLVDKVIYFAYTTFNDKYLTMTFAEMKSAYDKEMMKDVDYSY